MGVGDFLSNYLLGNAGPTDDQKKGTEQIWKLYQQAYNVKPDWDGKKWVIPPAAIARFNMLLPILQAQAGRSGAAGGVTDKGALGTWIGETGGGIGKAILKKLGGGKDFEGILDKGINLFKGQGYDLPSSEQAPIRPLSDLPTQVGTVDPGQWDPRGVDPSTLPSFEPAPVQWDNTGIDPTTMPMFGPDDIPAINEFSPAEYAAAGNWW